MRCLWMHLQGDLDDCSVDICLGGLTALVFFIVPTLGENLEGKAEGLFLVLCKDNACQITTDDIKEVSLSVKHWPKEYEGTIVVKTTQGKEVPIPITLSFPDLWPWERSYSTYGRMTDSSYSVELYIKPFGMELLNEHFADRFSE